METPDSEFELSREDRELLGRARRSRLESRAPEWVRQRIMARAVAELRQGRPSVNISAAELVPVAPSAPRASLLAAGLALAVVLPIYVRDMAGGTRAADNNSADNTAANDGADVEASGEAVADGARATPEPSPPSSRAAREASDRLLQAPLFKAPAGVLAKSAPPPHGPSLLGDRPFSQLSDAWQVRRWNDLTRDPAEPASVDFDEGALCVTLGAGERVLGGWPWAEEGRLEPEKVPLTAGQRYRLTFRAWAHDPPPSQLLFAVGHSRLPFSAAAGARVTVDAEPRTYVVDFDAPSTDPSIGVAFLATSARDAEQTRVCLSDVALHQR